LDRVLVQDHPRGPGLDDKQVDGVTHHVVEFAGHPYAFLGDHLPLERSPDPFLVLSPPGGGVAEAPAPQPDEQDIGELNGVGLVQPRCAGEVAHDAGDDDHQTPSSAGLGGVQADGIGADQGGERRELGGHVQEGLHHERHGPDRVRGQRPPAPQCQADRHDQRQDREKRRPAAGRGLADRLGRHQDDEDQGDPRIDRHRRHTAEATQRAGQPFEAH
jgi:hypothetical protein